LFLFFLTVVIVCRRCGGMEEIDSLWKRLSLNEIEGDKFNLGSSTQTVSYSLAAKFYTRRILNVEAVTRTFKPLWRTERGFSAKDMGDNILLFEFEDEADMERVLFAEPWSYDKYLVAFCRVVEDVEIENVVFDRVTFWVQIHNLPMLSLKREVAEALGRGIGEVLTSTESEEEMGGGRVMRIRVKVDITKPLCRGRKIGLANGKEGWAAFKYERLSNFCYWCGLVTHGEQDCAHWLRNRTSLGKKDQGYGAWMKADSARPNRKVEIHVEGRASHAGREPKTSPAERQQKPFSPEVQSAKHTGANKASPAPNLGSDTHLVGPTDFEDQLREIDQELGIFNEKSGHADSAVFTPNPRATYASPGTPHDPKTQQSPNNKGPLSDVTNLTKTGVGSWKKKARARGKETGGSLVILAEKRSSDCVHATCEDNGRPGKYPRTTPMEIELAEADHVQPRQNQ
jgi:hypothetical protein